MNQSTIVRRFRSFLTAWIASLLLFPLVSHAALAKASGGSGYSADLSSNATIKHQQLICDPAPGAGSATITYDASVVSVFSIFNEPGYAIDTSDTPTNNNFVGFANFGGAMATAPSFFASAGDVPQSGILKITWTPSSGNGLAANVIGQAPNPSSMFNQVASFGTNDLALGGANVFGVEFSYNNPLAVDPMTVAQYVISANAGGSPIFDADTDMFTGALTQPDFLIDPSTDPATNIAYTDISSAPVSGSLVPEPSSLALLGLGAIGLLARRRRNV